MEEGGLGGWTGGGIVALSGRVRDRGHPLFSGAVDELQRALHPLLAQIPRAELADRPPSPLTAGEVVPKEASSLYRPMVVSHEWTVSIQDVVDFEVEQFLADLYAMADDTGGQMVRGFLDLVFDVTDETGNVTMLVEATSSTLTSTRWRRST